MVSGRANIDRRQVRSKTEIRGEKKMSRLNEIYNKKYKMRTCMGCD
jgi:hypothetical protein